MNVCVQMCTQVSSKISNITRVCLLQKIDVYKCMCVCVCVCVCDINSVRIFQKLVFVHERLYTYICICKCACMNIYVCVCVCVYIYISAHVCIFMHPISKTIQKRQTRHVGHCWRSKENLKSDVLL